MTETTSTVMRRAFHSSIPELPFRESTNGVDCSASGARCHHPFGLFALCGFSALGQAGFGEGTSPPREPLGEPAVDAHERDAVPRGMDHPAVACVDAHVVDRRGSGTAPASPEEEEVAGLEIGER